MPRIKAHPLLDHPNPFCRATSKGQNIPEIPIAVSIVGIEGQSPLGLDESLLMLLLPHIDPAQELVGYGQGIIQSNRPLSQLKGPLQRLRAVRIPLKEPVKPIGPP